MERFVTCLRPNHQPPPTTTSRHQPPVANRQPPTAHRQHMVCPRAFWENCVQGRLFFLSVKDRPAPVCPVCIVCSAFWPPSVPPPPLHQGLNLSGNEIGSSGTNSLTAALSQTRTLQSVALAGNDIADSGAGYLAEGLKANASITTLHLGCNNIGFTGAVALAEALEVNRTLQDLDLSSNLLGDTGTRAVAEALATNPVLISLDLSHNLIRLEGARAVAVHARCVRHVSLKGNEIGAHGTDVFMRCLRSRLLLWRWRWVPHQLSVRPHGPAAVVCLPVHLLLNRPFAPALPSSTAPGLGVGGQLTALFSSTKTLGPSSGQRIVEAQKWSALEGQPTVGGQQQQLKSRRRRWRRANRRRLEADIFSQNIQKIVHQNALNRDCFLSEFQDKPPPPPCAGH